MELCMNLKLSKTFEKCKKNLPLPLLLWTPFSCFSFLFFSKNWIVHSVTAETYKFLVTVTIVLARRTCVFFFAFFRRAKASVMSEGRQGKNNACKTDAVVLPFSGEHEAGVEGETRSRSAPPALCSPEKTRTLSVCSAGYHSLIK